MPSPINMDVFLLIASLTALDVLPLVVMEISIMIFNTRQILKVVDQHHETEKGLEKSEESEGNDKMTTEILRSAIQPLSMNNSLNIQNNENNTNAFSGNNRIAGGGLFSSGQSRVPLDRPLYVNTSMTSQQTMDLYHHLSHSLQDSEPALMFRIP